ncbi:helix-turn-helix transcriptional regulator [Rhodocytophaga aerolata]|uniref:Helix-turn-helix transcriptional regulator n=1 Tax=Rhodocytophaga aerolata TaxID=455078 RepID=A0ABT8RJI1_9BACT|nr:helix-turn-helix transcriptional regulator [Rhodocytophaga aerolata]MDO1451075.1 helix-turn-helix transcriptional regulator [Rhodocytophaga aerolata]
MPAYFSSMDTIGQVFGAVLYKIRQQKGLTQEKLAERSNVDRKYIYLLEKGKRQPTLTTIFALASALAISPLELIEEVLKQLKSEQ